MSTTTVSNDMTIDEALQKVNEKYDTKISESDSEIQGMIDDHDKLIKSQIAALDTWKTNQTNLQNEQTDFTIQQIEEQKKQTEKDYIKEQSGAYKDWQKQSDKYGVNAEQMASSGMNGSGYSESSQVAMYNQYQSRVTTAREVFNRSVIAYDNSMTEARLQNNSILAEIAYNALVAQNELALSGLQYKNGLILEKANRKMELESMRDEEWYEILKQMNAENTINGEDGQSGGSDIIDKDGATGIVTVDDVFGPLLSNSTNSTTPLPFPTDIESIVDIVKNYKDTTDNMESIRALGLGIISAEKLAKLVAEGKVIVEEKNGQRYYMWHPDYATKLRK